MFDPGDASDVIRGVHDCRKPSGYFVLGIHAYKGVRFVCSTTHARMCTRACAVSMDAHTLQGSRR